MMEVDYLCELKDDYRCLIRVDTDDIFIVIDKSIFYSNPLNPISKDAAYDSIQSFINPNLIHLRCKNEIWIRYSNEVKAVRSNLHRDVNSLMSKVKYLFDKE